MPYISVDIPVVGEWPSRQDLDARNAVIDELDARRIGQFVGSGGGRGSMDFSYKVHSPTIVEPVIREVVAKYLPDRDYSVYVQDE
jgi:hypothetical protein